jgi:hypothetical protein
MALSNYDRNCCDVDSTNLGQREWRTIVNYFMVQVDVTDVQSLHSRLCFCESSDVSQIGVMLTRSGLESAR